MSTQANSQQAKQSLAPVLPSMRERVYAYIDSCGMSGATDDEIEVALGMKHQTASARRKDLWDASRISWDGRKRKTRSGCLANVWITKAAAVRAFAKGSGRGNDPSSARA